MSPQHGSGLLVLRWSGREDRKKRHSLALLTEKGYKTVITAPAPPLYGLFSSTSTPTPRKPTSCRRGEPNCSPGRPRVRGRGTNSCAPPTPTPAPRPSNAGAGERLARRPLSELSGGKDHTAPCPAMPGAGGGGLSPQPPPRASPLRRPAFLPQPLTCSCSQLRRCGRRLRPRRFRSALVPLPPTPPSRFRHHCSPGPAPWLPPSFPPPSTGSRDGDGSCAAHPHPQTGILPTSPIARELRGSVQQFSRDPSPWQRLQQRQPGAGAEPGRGPMWGLQAEGGGGGSREVGMKQWGLR